MQPVTMSVFFDYKCNFACDHCSVGSSPETVFEMPEEVYESAFEQAKEISSLQQMVFTGGEVTLHKDRLIDAIERATEAGFKTRIVTNGWWAHDMESAREMVGELADAGLDEINTSYDDFHTEFMGPENIVNLVEASLEEEQLKNVVVAMVLGPDATWDQEKMTQLLHERDIRPKENSRLMVFDDYADPLGSGAQLDVGGYSGDADADNACSDVVSTVSLHPDGSIKACCGHAQFYQPDLTLGNLNDDPLADILDRGTSNLVYWLIHEIGPKQIIEMLDVDDEQEYTGICHACNSLFENYREEFVDFIEENREELIRDEVILGDTYKQHFATLAENKEEILEQLEGIEQGERMPGDVRTTP